MRIRARFRVTAAIAVLLALAPPVAADTIGDPAVIGQPVWAGFVGNHPVGGPGNYRAALRGKAPFAGCFDRFETYLIAEAGGTGYSGGTGGTIRATVRALDAAGLPAAQIGGQALYTPGLVNGGLAPGQSVAGTLFPEWTLSAPACLTAGQGFAVVLENTDSSPTVNFLGVNSVGTSLPRQGPAVDPLWNVLRQPSGQPWRVFVDGDGSYAPILRLCAGPSQCVHQTYMESAGPQRIGATVRARQLVTPTAATTVRRCTVLLGRASSAATDVRIGLTDAAGNWLNGGTAFAWTSIAALPVQSSGYAQREVTVTLPAPVTLVAGQQVALVVRTPTAQGVWVNPMQDGAGYFETTGGLGGTVDRVQRHDGTAWGTWNGEPAADLSGFCAP